MHTSHPFAHRTNTDGTIDSICKTCFATVGNKRDSLHLKELEDAHTCDPWKLEVIRTVMRKVGDITQE
jgi:hypothetical protein